MDCLVLALVVVGAACRRVVVLLDALLLLPEPGAVTTRAVYLHSLLTAALSE
jgi:hypothetical protein